MSLEPAAEPTQLYLARSEEVNRCRPVFTGDVFSPVDIPGVGTGAAIVIGHPCSIRGSQGRLSDRIPVAAVEMHQLLPAARWSTGFFKSFPMADLPLPGEFHAARLDLPGLARSDDLLNADRIACLSHPGINFLQQRLVFHLTRVEVPTARFQEAFQHTYDEADLLEEWCTELSEDVDAAASFEVWVRAGDPSPQTRLLDPAQRALVRREMRAELKVRRSSPGSA